MCSTAAAAEGAVQVQLGPADVEVTVLIGLATNYTRSVTANHSFYVADLSDLCLILHCLISVIG